MLLYACTVNIVQTSSNARAKDVSEMINREAAELGLDRF
jgi:hypothetical protein